MKITKPFKTAAIAAVAALSLTGCIRVDTTMTFADGKVTPVMTVSMNQEFAKSMNQDFDSGDETSPTAPSSTITDEDAKKICDEMMKSGDRLAGEKVTSKGVKDGWVTCELTSDPVEVNSLKSDTYPFKATFDSREKLYTVNLSSKDLMKSAEGDTSDMNVSPTQMKALGVEMNATLKFKGEVKSVTVDGKELAKGASAKGVTVKGDSVKVDLLDSGDVKVVGSDHGNGSNVFLYLLPLLLLTLLAGGAAFFFLNRRKGGGSPAPAAAVNGIPQSPHNPTINEADLQRYPGYQAQQPQYNTSPQQYPANNFPQSGSTSQNSTEPLPQSEMWGQLPKQPPSQQPPTAPQNPYSGE